ncbi:MAG: restriction endonuclease [Planctomycetes bacterium B3_Pla]|nr:MAG: restriction endonuclease [Planctomycetes bacterium B3_Pla]
MIRLKTYSFRFAEQVLNARLALKQEVEGILLDPIINLPDLSRPRFNQVLDELFKARGWQPQPQVFPEPKDPSAKMDFLKDRVGVEVGFGHASFMGIDLLKFQVSSYSSLDQIDVGVYVVTTRSFQKTMISDYSQKWEGSLTFEKVERYLPHFKSAIQIPIYLIGIDL